MRRRLLMFTLLVLFAVPVFAAEPIQALVPHAKMVGEGRLSVVFWDVYDATLYAPKGKLAESQPYALSIRYLREIEGQDIADRSIEEMQGQGVSDEGRLAAWHSQMKQIFPDVQNGTVLSAVFIPGKKTIFYQGNKRIGIIKDAEFTTRFANIWLGENTSEPGLRRKLLGLS